MLSPSAIDGIWDCTVATPIGKVPHELTVRSAADGTLTGAMKNLKSGDSMPLLEARISGNLLTWSMELTNPFEMTFKVEVRIQDSRLSGQASAGMFAKTAGEGRRRA